MNPSKNKENAKNMEDKVKNMREQPFLATVNPVFEPSSMGKASAFGFNGGGCNSHGTDNALTSDSQQGSAVT